MSDPQDSSQIPTEATPSAPVEFTPSLERIWSDISERHQDYLNAMTESHRAYLNAASTLLGQAGSLPRAAAHVPRLSAPARAPVPQASPAPLPAAAKPIGSNGSYASVPQSPAQHTVKQAPPAAKPAAAVPIANVSAPVIDAASIVRSIVSDKTGYPPDMLEDDMDLEGELGVDSIKQVEILSALRDQYPSLPEVDPEHLAELRTIRKIADFFG